MKEEIKKCLLVTVQAFSGGKYDEALKYADQYIEQWTLGNKCDENHVTMLYMGAFSANRLEDYQHAMKFWNLFPWKKKGFDAKKYWAEMLITKEGLKKIKNTSNALVKSDIKLTIGILVSNRVQYIRKSMEALKPLLDSIPCELIAVDTKGAEGDGSIDIVREYTDKIYPFTWCNDFAKARNVCIEHALGEWFMYQDDDEWFDDVQEIIDFFTTDECENYMSAYYYVKNYDVMGNSEKAIVSRMIRRLENTHFVGKVHECFNEMFKPCKEFQCFVHHMGYAYFTEEDQKAHQDRNVAFLKEEIKENGYSPRMCAQMVQEFLTMDCTAKEGFEFAKESLEKMKKQNAVADSASQWMIASVIRYSVVYESYEFAKEQWSSLIKEYKLSEMAEMVMAAVMIGPAKSSGNFAEAIEYVNCFIEKWDWLQANSEKALVQSQLDFPKYYNKEYYHNVLYEGAVIANKLEDYRLAMTYWNRMPWKEEGFDGSRYFAAFNETREGYKKMLEEAKKEKARQEQNSLQKEIEDLMQVLFETKPVLWQCLKENCTQDKTELLAGMQEVVITLGNKLETLLGENTPQIRVLERCCELLWQCANEEQQEFEMQLAEEFYATVANLFE